MKFKDLAIAILAAGQGKRMHLQDLPKVLVPLEGKPLIDYVLTTALELNPQKIFVIVGKLKELVIEHIKKNYSPENILFVEQSQQLGTAHAILQLEPVVDNSFKNLLVLSGDVPLITSSTISDFLEFHYSSDNHLSLISTTLDNPFGYGRIIRDSSGNVVSIIEQKDLPEELQQINEINSGIYVFKTENLFNYLKQIDNDNAQREYYLTDAISLYRSNNLKVGVFHIDSFWEVIGINKREELIFLESLINKNYSQ